VNPLGDLMVALVGALPSTAGEPGAGATITVTTLDLTVPIESRIGGQGVLHASLPRGVMDTGFRLPLGRLKMRATVERTDAPDEGGTP
jgi:hypothetical protein